MAIDWRGYHAGLVLQFKQNHPAAYTQVITFLTNNQDQLADAARKLQAGSDDTWWQWNHFWGMVKLRNFALAHGFDEDNWGSLYNILPGLVEIVWNIVSPPP